MNEYLPAIGLVLDVLVTVVLLRAEYANRFHRCPWCSRLSTTPGLCEPCRKDRAKTEANFIIGNINK